MPYEVVPISTYSWGVSILASITPVFAIADILMALCLHLVLPKYLYDNNYIMDMDELDIKTIAKKCKCMTRIECETNISTCALHLMPQLTRLRRAVDVPKSPTSSPHSFLVSIMSPAYADDRSTKFLIGTGAIISANWALTGSKHMEHHRGAYTVRSWSIFWFRYGVEHSIVDVRFANIKGLQDICVVKVLPQFLVFKFVLPVIYPASNNWNNTSLFGWGSYDMYLKKRKYRYKYQKYFEERWTKSKISKSGRDCTIIQMCEKDTYGNTEKDNILMSDGGELLAIGSYPNKYFQNLNIGPMKLFLEEFVEDSWKTQNLTVWEETRNKFETIEDGSNEECQSLYRCVETMKSANFSE